ncbi:parasitic phase-specific protein psp-1 [Schizosaccharomyces osmophilus]|uniref:Parasitic phase-specific protein psp-1 n=1 Tax=Schizosaccharomyces osmophilus TaxID=2545709 RepID=A0AAE9WA89_9SCHI|nr:parasitic phase-specific protein psp-1 [Schizosaccharomyces osmophilus]WBW72084.1 parasitic phase-specific protein psp-1 [Schizosaccharomyces osmophilus]
MVLEQDVFGYIPNNRLAGIAIALFIIAFLLQIGMLIKKRKNIVWVPLVGTFGELAGWICRAYAHSHFEGYSAYIGQSIALLISPILYSAVLYVLLYQWALIYGAQFSLLPPKLYVAVFVTADVIAFLIQCSGGGLSSSKSSQNLGFDIALGGIIFQLLSTILYVVLLAIFVYGVIKNRPMRRTTTSSPGSPRTKTNDLAFLFLILSTIATLVRIVYRVIEFASGRQSKVATTELWFALFDFVPMIITACFLIPALYPCLYEQDYINFHPNFLPPNMSQSSEMDEVSLNKVV